MSIWTQIEDSRVTSIPPDGRTLVDVYALFSFSNADLPDGTPVKFIIGKGELPVETSDKVTKWTLTDIFGAVTPIDGVNLVSEDGEIGFQCTGLVKDRIVRRSDGTLGIMPVAKCSITPISDILANEITVIAYTDYDKSGQIKRLQPSETKLTIMPGEGAFLAVTERYDPVADEWTEVASMNTGRSGLFCEAANGKLYAAGGFNGNFTYAMEEYDPSSDSWSNKTALPIPRGYGSTVVHDNKIYVIGGYNFSPGRCSELMHRYDPITGEWTRLADLPLPVSHGCAEVIGDDIYIMFGATEFQDRGGKDELPKSFNVGIFRYDITSDIWYVEDVDTSPVATPASSTLSDDAIAGDVVIKVPSGAVFPSYGVATIDRSGTTETVIFTSFDSALGELRLNGPLAYGHSNGDTIVMVSLPETRMTPNSLVDGTEIKIFNGMSYAGLTSATTFSINTILVSYDTSAKTFTRTSTSPVLPRIRASDTILTVGSDRLYTIGGSAKKSDFLNDLEYYDVVGGGFVGNMADMLYSRHSLGCAALGGYAYATGGGGSGHLPGWLQMEVTTTPESVLADGKQTSGVSITALDDSGDPPPNGTLFRAKGVVFVSLEQDEQPTSSTQEVDIETFMAEPPPVISLLPVAFSSKEMSMENGIAATVLLGRSEDPIREVENLFQYLKNGESAPPEESLKVKNELFRHESMKVGEERNLYNIGIEITCVDDFYFGRTDTQSTISGRSADTGLSTTSSGFSFNPDTANQGVSGNVSFYSDITSVPDVYVITDTPVNADSAKDILTELREEVPFGASPHFDAIVHGARARSDDVPEPPLAAPAETMVTASDNDESFSSYPADDVVEEVNDIRGRLGFPVFVTSFIVTDPVSLAARRARTDVADLELISSETGGNSFSVVDQSYVDFVIERIKSSAPSSIGSGVILATKNLEGSLRSVNFEVEGVPGNPGTVIGASANSAEMRIWTSDDNYNFEDVGVTIPPNTVYSMPVPIRTSHVRYEITLRSKTFDSPILKSVSINYVEDNVQYIFTLPQTVSGQVSEVAITANHRLPTGGKAEGGIFHGDSVMFDRDYSSTNQPAVEERGTIMVVNRSFDTYVGDNESQSTRDVLRTDDFLVYKSVSGPWSQQAATRVYLNEIEARPLDYLLFPENGIVAFRKKLSPDDVVSIEVTLPSNFRIGMKITNPTLEAGAFDEFAFMYGVTQDDSGIRMNRAPRVTNLFISSPVLPGGPIVANYTFSDPDGNEEDTDQTKINWFRNGAIVPELKNLRSVTNSALIAKRADSKVGLISKGQEWFFTVRPSDGFSFGNLVVSHSVVVSNQPPTVENLRIESTGDPIEYLSTRAVVARFDFTDDDLGDESKDSIFTWFVNGVEIKSGTENGISPDDKDTDGQKYLKPGNTVRVDMIPSDGTDLGVSYFSDTITIIGTPPTVENVRIMPEAPSSTSTLRLLFDFVDEDKGTEQSDVAWYKNDQRVSELDNSRDVNALLTTPGEKWQAVVTPYNGLATGEPVRSTTVLIQF